MEKGVRISILVLLDVTINSTAATFSFFLSSVVEVDDEAILSHLRVRVG